MSQPLYPQALSDVLGAIADQALNETADKAGIPAGQVPASPAPTSQAAPVAQQADPAPAPAAPVPQPATPPVSQPAETKLLLGKYKTEEEATKGYHELLRMNKLLLQKQDEIEKTRQATPVFTPAPIQQPQADPAATLKPIADKLLKLEETTGIPAADLQDIFTGLARTIAREESTNVYKTYTEPEKKLAAADEFVQMNYPEFFQFRDEISQFARTDPATNAIATELWNKGMYKEAMLHSGMAWKLHSGAQVEHALKVGEEVRREEVEAARQDAGLISTSAQGARESAVQPGMTEDERNNAVRMWRAGYKEPLLRQTIGRTLPDELFGV